jgi:hypothetical protein
MRPSRVAAAALALSVLSCGSQGAGSGTGKITVLLKDAPADVRAAVITIAEVDLVGPGGDLVLATLPVTTNLLTLANEVTALVDGAVIPAGPYSQLRLVITGGYLDVAGAIYASSSDYPGLPPGTTVTGDLRMPSYSQSGLKVILPDGFTVGEDSKLLVDFDVTRSFGHEAGGSGAWVMHPVVKAAEVQATGSIAVTLALGTEGILPSEVALTDFQAVLTPAGGVTSTVLPLVDRGNGTAGATFRFLFPGDYSVSFQAPGGITFSTQPAVPATVPVVANQVTAADFLLLDVIVPR